MTTNDAVTTVGAWGAIMSPAWLPSLQQTSDVAGRVAPILGVIWLLVQIWSKVYSTVRDLNDRKGR